MSIAWHEIHDHLSLSSTTLNFQRSFDAIRCDGGPIARFHDSAGMLQALHQHDDQPDQKNRILTTCVRAAQSSNCNIGDCALTLMLLALWPGLDAIRQRSIRRKIARPDETASDILARTTEAIRGLDLHRVNKIAATVLRNVERDMLRACCRETERQNLTSDTDPDDLSGDRDGDDHAFGSGRLHDELRGMIGDDATLVIHVAIEGYSQAEAAAAFGLSHAAARKRYQRAICRLRGASKKIF